ncbi:hypothetical protein [Streptomyces nigra]|uniref:hypothetical protein n=1 Tax=Streptomyces nigra TaxID=1827580 RepID=UPI0036C37DB7
MRPFSTGKGRRLALRWWSSTTGQLVHYGAGRHGLVARRPGRRPRRRLAGPASRRRPLLQPAQQNLLDDLTALAGHTPGWRPRITDDAWTILLPLLTPLPHHGGRRRERQLLEAILHITCTRQPWT